MNDVITKKDLANGFAKLDAKIGKLDAKIDTVAASTDAKIDALALSTDARFTKADAKLSKFEASVDARFTRFETSVDAKIDRAVSELTAVMSQFANDVQSKLADHYEEFRKMNAKYDYLINTIDGFIGRIDRYETELAARDHKVDRLERWIQQIATQTGVKLP